MMRSESAVRSKKRAYVAAGGGGTVCIRRGGGRHRLCGSGSPFVRLRQQVEPAVVSASVLSAPETLQLVSPSIAFMHLVGFMK